MTDTQNEITITDPRKLVPGDFVELVYSGSKTSSMKDMVTAVELDDDGDVVLTLEHARGDWGDGKVWLGPLGAVGGWVLVSATRQTAAEQLHVKVTDAVVKALAKLGVEMTHPNGERTPLPRYQADEIGQAVVAVLPSAECPHGHTAEDLCNRLPDDRTLAGMRRLWDLLTVAEQMSWMDVRVVPMPPAALQVAPPTQEQVAEAIRGDRTRVRDAMRAAGAPEVRITTSPALHCVEPMDAAGDVLALLEQGGERPTVRRERLRNAIGRTSPEDALEQVVMALRVAGIGVVG